jgi:DNA gyrase/topoisomerase IV subunit A
MSHSPVYFDNDKRNELEAIIHDLEDENRLLQNEYERLCQEHMEKSLIINEQQEQCQINDREILREAKQLRQHKTKLEQRMKILEEHNKQLEKQLQQSKQLLLKEVKKLSFRISFICRIFSLLYIIFVGQLNDKQVRKISSKKILCKFSVD